MVGALVTPDGEVFSGASIRGRGTTPFLNDGTPEPARSAYNNVPEKQRGVGHGRCCEVDAVTQAIEALGPDSLQDAVHVAIDRRTGAVTAACGSCDPALSSMGIFDIATLGGC